MSADHRYIFIIAGGAGTRLWPLSRKAAPKQFAHLVGEQTLVQHMVELALQVVPAERIFVMTGQEFVTTARAQLSSLPPENICSEPSQRDNGPAILLAMLHLAARDSEATAAILWADHLIQAKGEFATTLQAAFSALEAYPTQLVTVGTKPTKADPTLGYIKMRHEIGEYANRPVFSVETFIEKPSVETAETFISSWEYLWNVGYKVLTVSHFLTQITQLDSSLEEPLNQLRQGVLNNDNAVIQEAYEMLPKQSIEHLYTQHLSDILVVPADIGWSDVGTWNTLHEVMQKGSSTVTEGPVLTTNTTNSLVLAKDKPIITVGIHDMIVVDAGDVMLVMHKSAISDIKEAYQGLTSTHPELL